MTEDKAAKLREPFPADKVGKLPRVTCRDCSANKTEKHCAKHQRSKCNVCGAFVSTAHIHLSYVGHAAVTDRLLQVDPGWTWQPMGLAPDGTPAVSTGGGLWINLTVCGVTRPGYGDAAGGQGAKEAIGDALRNAAMRFGVGLDLWSKEDLGVEPTDDDAPPSAADNGAIGPTPAATQKQLNFIKRLGDDLYKLIGADATDAFYAGLLERHRIDTAGMSVPEAQTVIDALLKRKEAAEQAEIPVT